MIIHIFQKQLSAGWILPSNILMVKPGCYLHMTRKSQWAGERGEGEGGRERQTQTQRVSDIFFNQEMREREIHRETIRLIGGCSDHSSLDQMFPS